MPVGERWFCGGAGVLRGLCNLVRKSLGVPPSGVAVEDLGHWTCRVDRIWS